MAPIAPVIKGMCDNAMAFAVVAEDFNQRVLLKQSEIFTKCANTFLKYAQAPVKGYVQGLEHVVTTYCPLLGRAFLDPVTAGKHVAAWTNECAHQVGSLLAGMLREEARADLLMHLVRTNQPAAQAILDQQLARQAVFDNAVKATIEHLGSLSGEQIVVSIFKGVTQYTADALIFHSIGSCIKNTASNARNIVNALRSSYAAEEAEILLMQTPEGFNLKVTNEFFSECQNTAKAKEVIASAEAAAKESALPSTTSGTIEKQAQKAGAKVDGAAAKTETACNANVPSKPPKKPTQSTHSLDKRLWSDEEQIEADAANKLRGETISEHEIGTKVEGKAIKETTPSINLTETLPKEEGVRQLINCKAMQQLDKNIKTLSEKTSNIKLGLIEQRVNGDTSKFLAALETAEKKYAEFRISSNDITLISKNTGLSQEILATIKNHIFYAEHKLSGNIFARFAADPDMALAWQRLIDGNFIASDLLLLLHEYAEALLLKNYPNLTAANVHTIAEALYNWKDFV